MIAGIAPVPQVIQLLDIVAVPPFRAIPAPIHPSILFLEIIVPGAPVHMIPPNGPFDPVTELPSKYAEEFARRTYVPLKQFPWITGLPPLKQWMPGKPAPVLKK
jgi:hypothetical protein